MVIVVSMGFCVFEILFGPVIAEMEMDGIAKCTTTGRKLTEKQKWSSMIEFAHSQHILPICRFGSDTYCEPPLRNLGFVRTTQCDDGPFKRRSVCNSHGGSAIATGLKIYSASARG